MGGSRGGAVAWTLLLPPFSQCHLGWRHPGTFLKSLNWVRILPPDPLCPQRHISSCFLPRGPLLPLSLVPWRWGEGPESLLPAPAGLCGELGLVEVVGGFFHPAHSLQILCDS